MPKLERLMRVKKVEPLAGYSARFTFDDGVEKVIDLEKYLRGPIFQPIRDDPTVFRAMTVALGTIAWPNGADIDADVLYYNLPTAWMDSENGIVVETTKANDRPISLADILQAITKLNIADKAMLLSIISDQIADAVDRLETPEPVLALREEQAPYTTDTDKS